MEMYWPRLIGDQWLPGQDDKHRPEFCLTLAKSQSTNWRQQAPVQFPHQKKFQAKSCKHFKQIEQRARRPQLWLEFVPPTNGVRFLEELLEYQDPAFVQGSFQQQLQHHAQVVTRWILNEQKPLPSFRGSTSVQGTIHQKLIPLMEPRDGDVTPRTGQSLENYRYLHSPFSPTVRNLAQELYLNVWVPLQVHQQGHLALAVVYYVGIVCLSQWNDADLWEEWMAWWKLVCHPMHWILPTQAHRMELVLIAMNDRCSKPFEWYRDGMDLFYAFYEHLATLKQILEQLSRATQRLQQSARRRPYSSHQWKYQPPQKSWSGRPYRNNFTGPRRPRE